jgi:tripartite-type tricarboxylate transporter receptor subunit TctC
LRTLGSDWWPAISKTVVWLNAAILRAMAAPEVRARMLETGMGIATSTPAELERIVANDLVVNRELVRRLGLKPN